MSLCTLHEVLQPAMHADYAVLACNFFTYEDARAIVQGAEQCRAPIILMASKSCVRSLGVDLAAQVVRCLAERSSVPVVAHLDHADDLNVIFQAMKAGFTSVMYDGSMLPVKANIENTRIICRAAHALGISVEAEIGRVGMSEEGEEAQEILTTPESAQQFLEQTQVDALAVAVGTKHAMQKQEAEIRFDLVEKLSAVLDVPLVLHGSSGVPDGQLHRIAKTTFGKVNVGTVLRSVYVQAIKNTLSEHPTLKDHLKLLQWSSEAVTETVMEKIALLNGKHTHPA